MGDAALNLYDVLEDLTPPHGTPAHDEMRHARRARLEVEVDLSSEHNFWSGISMNISEGGLFVATHKLLPHGTRVVVSLTLPFEEEPIMALAEVKWTRIFSESSDAPPGMGLELLDLDGSALESIRRFIESAREPLLFEV